MKEFIAYYHKSFNNPVVDLRLFLAERVDSFIIKGLNNKLVAMSQFMVYR